MSTPPAPTTPLPTPPETRAAEGESTRNAPARGAFIAFEGGDGVGKTTHIELLIQWLDEHGIAYLVTREPGGTELGERIREILLHGGPIADRAEALLFAADRAHHVATVVRPALERGVHVITDRYLDSSVAYQGAGRKLDAVEIRDVSLWATEDLLPDLTVLLDLTPEAARRRRTGEDRLEAEPDPFHARVRERFLALAAADPQRYLVIDTERPKEEVAQEIRAWVSVLVAPRGAGPDPVRPDESRSG